MERHKKLAQELMSNHINDWLSGGCNEWDRQELTKEVEQFMLKNLGVIDNVSQQRELLFCENCNEDCEFDKWENNDRFCCNCNTKAK